jgi:hypothetical protein
MFGFDTSRVVFRCRAATFTYSHDRLLPKHDFLLDPYFYPLFSQLLETTCPNPLASLSTLILATFQSRFVVAASVPASTSPLLVWLHLEASTALQARTRWNA